MPTCPPIVTQRNLRAEPFVLWCTIDSHLHPPMKLSAIASALNLRLENGSPNTEITGLNGIDHAGPGELTFVSNPKYAAAARSTKAAAVIVAQDFPAIPTAM